MEVAYNVSTTVKFVQKTDFTNWVAHIVNTTVKFVQKTDFTNWVAHFVNTTLHVHFLVRILLRYDTRTLVGWSGKKYYTI